MAASDHLKWNVLSRIVLLALLLRVGDAVPAPSPPDGNTVLEQFLGVGSQIYQCGGNLSWTFIGASATLIGSTSTVASHYFLPVADGNGGRPTWALFNPEGIVDSSVTGKVVESVPDPNPANVNSLLLRATSHSGSGLFSWVSYIQRSSPQGGAAPPVSTCNQTWIGQIQNVPYQATYNFLQQDEEVDQSALPPAVALPAGSQPLKSFFGFGFQHYQYNGSSWVLVNASADLSYFPGSQVVGQHYFLADKDAKGGQPTWSTALPFASSVTGNVKGGATVLDSVAWLLLEVTTQTPSDEPVKFVQRLSTVGGLPPSPNGQETVGALAAASYSAIYRLYRTS